MRIPNEITCLIFTYASSELLTSWISSSKFGYSNTEVHISHVCRHWRSLSLCQSSLWTTFYYLAYMAHANSTNVVQRLDAYLERSGTQHLFIWVDLRGNNHLQRSILMMDSIISHVDRWRQFVFIPDSMFPIDRFLLRIEHRAAPKLKLFSLSLGAASRKLPPFDQYSAASFEPLILRGGAPQLTTLWFDTSVRRYLPPASNITTLHIKKDDSAVYFAFPPPLSPILSILNLTTLTLDGEHHGSYMLVTTAPAITTPNLTTLRICNQCIHSGLNNWRAPLLETLILERARFGEIAEAPETSMPGKYSFPNLRALVIIDNEPCSRHSAIVLTHLTSSIKELIISDSRRRPPNGYTPVTELFNYEYTNQGWPRLQKITLNIRSLDRRDPEFLVRCMQTRCQVSHPTLKLDSGLLKIWMNKYRLCLLELEHLCAIEPLASSISTIPIHWPAELHDGPFYKLFDRLETPYVPKYSFEE